MSNHVDSRVEQPGDNDDLTLYQQGGVIVTERWLIVEERRYQMRHLQHLRTARGPRSPHRVMLAVAIGILLISVGLAARHLNSLEWVGVGFVIVATMGFIVAVVVNSPRPSEMWGEYRGYTVRLLWLDNREHYNQICRAIIRAKERTAA